jgi:hypothetical protein
MNELRAYEEERRERNPWWAEFDKALEFGLTNGLTEERAEEFAAEMAEERHPGGKNL